MAMTDEEIRQLILDQELKHGEIVAAKYSTSSHTVTITGQLGKSVSAPYLMKSDGEIFRIEPRVKFTTTPYELASLDRVPSMAVQDYLREVADNGVRLPVDAINEEGVPYNPDGTLRVQAAEPERDQAEELESRFKSALDRAAESSGDAVRDLRSRLRGR